MHSLSRFSNPIILIAHHNQSFCRFALARPSDLVRPGENFFTRPSRLSFPSFPELANYCILALSPGHDYPQL